jgi:hypothetical protein
MIFNTIIRPSVGADLSRTPPIYRPSLVVPLSALFFETVLSAFAGFRTIQMKKLNINILSKKVTRIFA